MEELTGERFLLPYNKFISVKVQAFNLRGWGELSSVNINGVYTEVVPQKIAILNNAAETTETQLHVEWGPLTTQAEMGGATCSILSYNLEWDQGTGVWQELTGIYSLYTNSEHIMYERVSSGI